MPGTIVLNLLPRPLEAVARAAGALFEQRTIRSGAADDADTFAAVAGFDVEVAARGNPLELLIGTPVTGPYLDLGAIGAGGADNIQAFAALAANNSEISAARILEFPLLVAAAVPGPLLNPRSIGSRLIFDIRHFAAVAIRQPVIGWAGPSAPGSSSGINIPA